MKRYFPFAMLTIIIKNFMMIIKFLKIIIIEFDHFDFKVAAVVQYYSSIK